MRIHQIRVQALIALIAVTGALSCSREGSNDAGVDSLPPATSSSAAPDSSGPAPAAALTFVVAPSGTAARYRVREQLVKHDLPNDAVGETKNVTGRIAFDSSGKVIRQASKFVLSAGTFVSDQSRRDGFVRRRLLESEQYPDIVLVPTEVRGLVLPLPTSGTRPFQLTGDLTVHGVTRPTVWTGSVKFQGADITGNVRTAFTFKDISLEQPRVPVLLSVADTIRLEIDFHLVRER